MKVEKFILTYISVLEHHHNLVNGVVKLKKMKVLLIIISLSGIPTFKYYLGNNYILLEHLNPLTREKSFRLLQINERTIHVIDENFSKRTVESINFGGKAKWTSSYRKSTLIKKSEIYFLNGRECISKEFEIIIPSDSPINIFRDNKDRYRTLIKVFCRLPMITSYLTDDRGLNFFTLPY